MDIIAANEQHIPLIRRIVDETWPHTYGAILSKEQINYMIDLFYSNAALAQQMQEGHSFFLVTEADDALGFIDVEIHHLNNAAKLHKIYVLPGAQGKGIGNILMKLAISIAHPQKELILNVNRYNKAFEFYKKMGFEVLSEENIDIGNGYFMNDYVLKKTLA